MAKLPEDFWVVAELGAALQEGRDDEAKAIAIRHLKAKHDPFSEILVELLQGKKRKKHAPKFWAEIGSQIEALRASGISVKQAIAKLAREYKGKFRKYEKKKNKKNELPEKSVERARTYFRRAQKTYEEERERDDKFVQFVKEQQDKAKKRDKSVKSKITPVP